MKKQKFYTYFFIYLSTKLFQSHNSSQKSIMVIVFYTKSLFINITLFCLTIKRMLQSLIYKSWYVWLNNLLLFVCVCVAGKCITKS